MVAGGHPFPKYPEVQPEPSSWVMMACRAPCEPNLLCVTSTLVLASSPACKTLSNDLQAALLSQILGRWDLVFVLFGE